MLDKSGRYTNNHPEGQVAEIYRSGTAARWIVYRNCPSHRPLLRFDGQGGLRVNNEVAYIDIGGFCIQDATGTQTRQQAQ